MAIQKWPERPSNDQVRAYLQMFFDALRAGKLEDAERMVAHAYEDWDESIYNLFRDHYLVVETPSDSSFEGRGWDKERAWLADLTVKDGAEWMGKKGNVVWVDIEYRGEASGYVAEFVLQQDDEGYFVERQAFKMA